MAINMSKLVSRIKKDLGIYGLVLPIDNADEEIAEHIRDTTLETFSNFFPSEERVSLDLATLEVLKDHYQESIYTLPDVFGGRDIISIRRVKPRSLLLSGGYYAPYIDSTPDLYYGLMQGKANADLISSAAPPFTFKFVAPNKLYLYNITTLYGIIDVDFNMAHARNLTTVKKSMYDTIYQLSLIDVKNFLYGFLKHYKTINTAHGTITLEIDDWANAQSEREDLISKWREVYHLEQEQIYII